MVEKIKKAKQKLRSPSAFTILFVVIIIMAALTWIVPSGLYKTNEDGDRIANSYHVVEKERTVTEEKDGKIEEIKKHDQQGLWDVFTAPIKGMSDKLDVIVFVMVLGGFLGVTMKTGALDASLGALLRKMKGKEKWLIPILMIFFAIGGTTYGMQEETVAFYALVIPMMIAAGYNAMTGVMVIVLGAGTGVLGSTINPFSTGVAAKTAGVKLGSVIPIMSIILVLCLIAAIIFTMRYAAKVKAGKYKEDVRYKPATAALDITNVPKLTGPRKVVMAVFAITFVLMILSLIPWGGWKITLFADMFDWAVGLPVIGVVLGVVHSAPFGDWYFNEITALFLISTIAITAIYYKEFKKEGVFPVDTFIDGVKDILPVALIIAVATGVSVVMTNGEIQDTVIGVVLGVVHSAPFGDWYFNEITALFLISTIAITAIYYKEFKKEGVFPVDTFIDGVKDILPVALIIAVATGVSVVMTNGEIQDTVISWGESLLKDAGGGIVGVLAYLFYLPMSFIVPSSSGLAAATMPVIAPIADLVGSSKEVMVAAFATASGLINMMAPTIASLMGGLALAGVSYRDWLKRSAPIMAVFAVISIAVIAIFGAL